MIVLLWVSLAMAGTLTIGVPEGHLRTQMENTVHVASADEDGRPRAIAPILEIGGERVTPAGLVKKGVWAYRFMGPLREGLLSIRAETEADRREWVLPVEEVLHLYLWLTRFGCALKPNAFSLSSGAKMSRPLMRLMCTRQRGAYCL